MEAKNSNEDSKFVEDFRDYYTSLNSTAGEKDPLSRVEDLIINDVKYRIYTPENIDPNSPTILFIHGGGWISGNLETHDVLASAFANRSKAVTISVEYGLAPENPFPKGLEDCYDALLWIKDNINSYNGNANNIVLAGDSAGGNLALALALLTNDRNLDVNITAIISMYPVTTYFTGTNSFEELGVDYFPQTDVMKKFTRYYMGEEELLLKNPFISPLYADLSGLPPVLLQIGEKDPLKDQVKLFSEKLNKYNVTNEFILYQEVGHGFIQYFKAEENKVEGGKAMEKIQEFIKKYK